MSNLYSTDDEDIDPQSAELQKKYEDAILKIKHLIFECNLNENEENQKKVFIEKSDLLLVFDMIEENKKSRLKERNNFYVLLDIQEEYLVQSNALNVLFEKQNHNLTNQVSKERTENAVLKKDNNSWNGFKIGGYATGIFAFCLVSYVALRIYHTLYYKDPKDDEIDKELVQLAENYEAWVANHRAEADEYTKGLYAEFDTAVVRRDIREGASPKDEFLKYFALYGENVVHMMRRFGINIQDKELMKSIFGC